MRDLLEELYDSEKDADPVRLAQGHSGRQLPKRFYEQAAAAEDDGGFVVQLDGKTVRTPARSVLKLQTRALAELIADEWNSQEKLIDPAAMPATRLANTALDGVALETEAVLEDVLRFAGTDLLCYRAGSPEGLVASQNEAWDPIIDWAHSRLGARFLLAEGVMHVEQPSESLRAVNIHLKQFQDPFAVAALHSMTSLTGSALLALAVAFREIEPEEAWAAAHVDEDWNIRQWGEDAEARLRRDFRQREMMAAANTLQAVTGG
ncbi:ATPase [Hoeflea sp. WL0058]|uniref:ATPase n=1 Tax=Flavimaribacter sediminis TaxID=2865987 RepID=A0AAE2ZLS2_9HYPH|nr:ATP12 family protein [Flavimaribacter sediminis]MBW8636805.1 ATPase [Flavimaribacter sediminis]